MHGLDVKLELLHAGEAVLGAVDAGEGVRGELEAGGLREGGHGHRVERVPRASRRRTRLVLQNLRRDTQNKGIRIQARCNAKRASPNKQKHFCPECVFVLRLSLSLRGVFFAARPDKGNSVSQFVAARGIYTVALNANTQK